MKGSIFWIATALAAFPVQKCQEQYFLCLAPNDGDDENTCCYEKYGLIMQTQFWDSSSNPGRKRDSNGQPDKFTIHGLWNDLCDGSYKQYCNRKLEIGDSESVRDILVKGFQKEELWDKMSQYWLNDNGDNEELWKHEFNKHGTCFSTILPSCFTDDYQEFENAVAFYQKTVEIWELLQTYDILLNAGITPSFNNKFSLSDIENALSNAHSGKKVYVGCDKDAVSQIWYYHHVKGSILDGDLTPADSVANTNCPSSVWYYPK